MNKLITRIIAISMAFSLMLTFAACSDKNNDTTTDDETTQAKQVDVTVDETTQDEPTTLGEEEPTEEIITGKEQATEKVDAKGINAPVNGSKADIVKFYNTYANATKAYSGTVKIHREQQKKADLAKFEVKFLRGLANGMLSKAMGERDIKDKTFTKGKSSDGTTLVKFLPPGDKAKMSTLTASQVKSATCTATDGGWKVKLTLVEEKVGYNGNPKAHQASMDILAVTDKDVDPFEIVKDTCEFKYSGATIEAVVNEDGLLDSLKIFEPVYITATLKKGVSIDAEVNGSWEQDITFKY
ncbi:MAG TPA: hypothetical protein VFD52_04310 [Clostridia bacterium]|nr:hypothetical protein [Clostridia bacterium]